MPGVDGHVHLRQAINLAAAGAVSGSFWGVLIGVLFLNPLVGLAVGAGAGAASGALSDIGINDQFLLDLGETLPKGSAALPRWSGGRGVGTGRAGAASRPRYQPGIPR